MVEDILPGHEDDPDIHGLPLGALYGLMDEWDSGWGRTRAQLADAVTAACREQVAT